MLQRDTEMGKSSGKKMSLNQIPLNQKLPLSIGLMKIYENPILLYLILLHKVKWLKYLLVLQLCKTSPTNTCKKLSTPSGAEGWKICICLWGCGCIWVRQCIFAWLQKGVHNFWPRWWNAAKFSGAPKPYESNFWQVNQNYGSRSWKRGASSKPSESF